jgi:hypothetical protein
VRAKRAPDSRSLRAKRAACLWQRAAGSDARGLKRRTKQGIKLDGIELPNI